MKKKNNRNARRRPKGAPKRKKGGKMPIRKLIKEVRSLVLSVKDLVNKEAGAKVSPNFNFVLNDPAANSSLVKNIPPPSAETGLKVSVRGFVASPSTPDQILAAQVYTILENDKKYMQGIIAQHRAKFTQWAGTKVLNVIPKAGVDFNAYYDRKNLKFFYDTDTVLGKTVYSCRSSDIVSHELGHGILDTLRPDLWSAVAMEIWSFHESFGDIMAIISALQYDEVINYTLSETSNNLSLSNTVTKLAEELGIAIYNVYNGASWGAPNNALRDASVDFNYVRPSLLPSDGPDNVLVNEPHSFSRVFTSAFWDALVAIKNKNVTNGQSHLVATKNARDTMASYLIKACILAPANTKFYYSVANSFLAADVAKGSPYQTELRTAFQNKGILPVGLKALEAHNSINKGLIKLNPGDEVFRHKEGSFVRLARKKMIKLSACCSQGDLKAFGADDHLKDMLDVHVEIPADRYFSFDNNGDSIEEIKNNEQECIKDIVKSVKNLKQNNLIGSNKTWEIKANKLERNKICRICARH